MFVRALFLLLLALNVGGALWLALARYPQASQVSVPTTDPGVPELVLLSERDSAVPLANVESAAAPESTADPNPTPDQCRTLGPFQTQADTRAAMNALTPLVKRIRARETYATQTHGYWVYLPATPSREQALATARVLSQKGVLDYYVVTAGDQLNTISLGLFHDPNNAEHRRAEIAALGFSPQVNARTEDLPAYWLDYMLASPNADWHGRIAEQKDLHEETVACF
ncbi:MAG: SPOR domain-containing protein [Rhodanobacter sp.]|jgi:cell division protein FtsN|nr:SPOR domain-containing protein [Rhodanobacter sp.]